MDEASRQQALLRALNGTAPIVLHERGERAARGLTAYRVNADALAERALAAAFPTVRTLIGHEDFAQLARQFAAVHPPRRGDLAEWGDALPAWLQAHDALKAWPYLGDCARVDFALHRSERAADARLDAASLSQLESVEPARLCLQLVPGTCLIESAWPVVTIHRAHRVEGGERADGVASAAADAAFEAARVAIAERRAESALVVREGWRAALHRLTAAEARWTHAVLAGTDLASALERAGDEFDFAAWLQTAIRAAWLKGVVARDD